MRYFGFILVNNAWENGWYSYWFFGGLIIDLSGTGIFFGVSPFGYSITGYLGGNLNGAYKR
ncbi:hypothetical protein Ct9H90mP29_17010 [bacterium]|nr:MAG: hypothetical protein Ct9H90mP29_17010 [bacterium]